MEQRIAPRSSPLETINLAWPALAVFVGALIAALALGRDATDATLFAVGATVAVLAMIVLLWRRPVTARGWLLVLLSFSIGMVLFQFAFEGNLVSALFTTLAIVPIMML